MLDGLAVRPELLTWAFQYIDSNQNRPTTETKSIAANQIKLLTEKEKELENLKHMRLKDFVTDEDFLSGRLRINKEMVTLRERIEKAEYITATKEQFKDSLAFIAGARDLFARSPDPEDRKKILSYFGTEHRLKDRKFSLAIHDWMIPVLTDYKKMEKSLGRLEPAKTLPKQNPYGTLHDTIPVWWALVDEVWTRFLEFSQNMK